MRMRCEWASRDVCELDKTSIRIQILERKPASGLIEAKKFEGGCIIGNIAEEVLRRSCSSLYLSGYCPKCNEYVSCLFSTEPVSTKE